MAKTVDDAQIKAILYKNAHQKPTGPGPARSDRKVMGKPYSRPDSTRSKTSEGSWTHDLFLSSIDPSRPSRAQRSGPKDLLATTRGNEGGMLADRLVPGRGGPVELLPTVGAGTKVVPVRDVRRSGQRGGRELLPPPQSHSHSGGMEVDGPITSTNTGMGIRTHPSIQPQPQPQPPQREEKKEIPIVVRVDELIEGTSESDLHAAFSPQYNLIKVELTTTPPVPRRGTVSALLTLGSRGEAGGMIDQYNGVLADGNRLSFTILGPVEEREREREQGNRRVGGEVGRVSLGQRMGLSGSGTGTGSFRSDQLQPQAQGPGSGQAQSQGQGQAHGNVLSSLIPHRAARPSNGPGRGNRGTLLDKAMRGVQGGERVGLSGDGGDGRREGAGAGGGIGKLYSDTILQSDPYASVITLEEPGEGGGRGAEGGELGPGAYIDLNGSTGSTRGGRGGWRGAARAGRLVDRLGPGGRGRGRGKGRSAGLGGRIS